MFNAKSKGLVLKYNGELTRKYEIINEHVYLVIHKDKFTDSLN